MHILSFYVKFKNNRIHCNEKVQKRKQNEKTFTFRKKLIKIVIFKLNGCSFVKLQK